jgi:hypothetical protein
MWPVFHYFRGESSMKLDLNERGDYRDEARVLRYSRSTRFGAGIGLICFFTIVGVGLLAWLVPIQDGRDRILISLASLGSVLVLWRPSSYFREASADEVLHFCMDPHYWGVIFLFSSAAIYGSLPLLHPATKHQPLVVRARTRTESPTPAAKPEPDPEPPEFPPLKVTGVIINGTRSSAVVEGRAIMLHERIEKMELVEVTERGITMELRGFKHSYRIGEGKPRR